MAARTSTLQSSLQALASTFAESVLDAIRGASLDELVGVKAAPTGGPRATAVPAERHGNRRRGGRIPRRSQAEISGMIDRIVKVLEKNPEGLRAEDLRAELAVDARELPRPLAEALAAKRIKKKGERRATTYFAR